MSTRNVQGRIVHVGDDISADLILPARWVLKPPEEAARHLLEDLDPALPARILEADIIVAGKNFGGGTGREATLRAIRAAGIRAVVAVSAARLFYRNAINNGILVIQTPQAELLRRFPDGTLASIDPAAGILSAEGIAVGFEPLPPAILGIVAAGGLENYGASLAGAGNGGAPDRPLNRAGG